MQLVDVTWYDFLLCLEVRQPSVAPDLCMCIHNYHSIAWASRVACSTTSGNARTSERGMGNTAQIPTFFCIYTLEKPLHQIAEFGGFIGIIKLLYIMKRKFISALLFGALCLTPTSTFVSCSDYDDDIENLQKQITTNAATLEELANEKLSNVKVEIESLKSAQEGLEAAYKEADEETRKASIAAAQALVDEAVKNLEAALQAANERLDGQAGSIAALVAADAKLQEGIDKAEAQANHAYTLAEEARATANGNKEELAKLAESLKSIRDGLADQINVLGEDVKALTGRVGALEGALAAQEAALTEQGKKDAELEKSIADLKKEVEANKTALETLVNNKVQEVLGKIDDVKTSISALDTAYKAADAALQGQISDLKSKIENSETGLAALSGKIDALTGLVNVLYANLTNLITGVIVQDATSEFEAVYAKVANFTTNPGETGKTYYGREGIEDYVYFPYKGATGAEKLYQNQYNVEKLAGSIYATINPNTVDFNGQKLSLLNSKDEANKEYQLKEAKTADKLISRAASKNGLYELPVVNVFNEQGKSGVMTAPATADKVVYALAAVDNTKGVDGKPVGRKVYSRYEINVNATAATALTNADFELVGKGAEKGNSSTVYDYLFSETNASNADLTGTLQLKPFFEEHNIDRAKVYRKYLVCTGANNPSGNAQSAEKTAAVNDMNANAGFSTVLAEGDELFNEIPVTIGVKYNGWIFTYDYYIWNYDGSIYKNTYKVIYTKPMIETQNIAMSHTPESNLSQVVKESTPDFGELLCMKAENKKWVDNVKTVSVGVVSCDGASMSGREFSAVTFTNAAGTDVQTIALANNAADKVTLTAAKVKKISLTYNPGEVAYDKVYTIPVKFFNAQGNTVNTVNIMFTMNRPTALDGFIQRIPVAFDGNVTIAWAEYDATHPGYAIYRLAGSYNNVDKDLNDPALAAGAESKILFKDKTVYNTANKNLQYRPVLAEGTWQYATPFEFNNVIAVPNKAVDRSSKENGMDDYVYNLEAGIKYFGLGNLYGATENFQLKWYSPIYHAPFKVKDELVIQYPGTLDVTNSHIQSTDPSKSNPTPINYLANRDYRIANVEIKPIMNGKVFADPNTGLFTAYEVSADGTKLHFETAEKSALQGPATVDFHLVVTDVFGCVKTHTISVKVEPNSSNAPKK